MPEASPTPFLSLVCPPACLPPPQYALLLPSLIPCPQPAHYLPRVVVQGLGLASPDFELQMCLTYPSLA